MPDVINLGQFGDPHPSPMHGLADAFKTIADQKEKEKEFSLQMIKSQQEKKYHQNKLTVELARLQHQQQEDDYKHTQTMIKQLGILKDTDRAKYMQVMAGEGGKHIIKQIKDSSPENIDINAKEPWDQVIVPGIKEQASQKLDQIKVDYANAVRSGKPVDPYLQQSFDAISMHGVDDISRAFEGASKAFGGKQVSPEEFKPVFQKMIKQLKDARYPNQDQNDPAGIKQYLPPQYANALASGDQSGQQSDSSKQY